MPSLNARPAFGRSGGEFCFPAPGLMKIVTFELPGFSLNET